MEHVRTGESGQNFDDKNTMTDLDKIKKMSNCEHEEIYDMMNVRRIAEYDISMKRDANRIAELCKVIINMDDGDFAKVIDVLKNSSEQMSAAIYKILLKERRG